MTFLFWLIVINVLSIPFTIYLFYDASKEEEDDLNFY